MPSKTFELEGLESSEAISLSLKQAVEEGIKKFVIFDDFIYSGSQMRAHIQRMRRVFDSCKDNDFQLVIVSGYTSQRFKNALENLKEKVHLITTETVLPSIEKVLEPADMTLLNKLYPDSALGRYHYLAYADWKVADIKSVPQFLHHGLKLQEGVFRFVRSPQPFYPPYKDREMLKDIYELDDPFENRS